MSDPVYYDVEAERCVLALVLSGRINDLPDGFSLHAGWFSEPNRSVFDAAWALYLESSNPADVHLVSLTNRLRDDGALDRIGGAGVLTSLMNGDVSPSAVRYSLERLQELAMRRDAQEGLASALEALSNGEDAGALRDRLNRLSERLNVTAKRVLSDAILGEAELAQIVIPKRESLMGEWFKSGDYGVIFGRRGLGKSWLALAIARALSEGRNFGPWEASTARRVLYVDGEMSLDDYRDRVSLLRDRPGTFRVLSHQHLFDQNNKALCLSDLDQQVEITHYCERERIDVLFLDNGACLFRGVAENDADEFRDKIEGWFLDLRRRGISVVLVLHAGRNGAIRGTSKREDAAFWILRLDEAGGADGEHGARFITRFAKNRNSAEDPPPLDWHFKPDGEKMLITHRQADALEVFRQWVADGLDTCSVIASEMNISAGSVSKLAKRAEKAGWLTIKNRTYTLNEA